MTATLILILRILLALSLYIFLGLMFITIWRQMRLQMKILSPQMKMGLLLYLVDQPDEEPTEIKQPDALIGRDLNCKIHIRDETVSAQHARLYLADQNWWINDLNSTNGTFLNEEPIDRPCVIADQDIIRVGQIKLRVQVNQPSSTDSK
ncbi:MAG: hypothetical protein CVU39_06490 [Chloroflexi bacterium HGW-Chloroflexi-10]|nr:MAG: hypothetical protein CVU39_06490 [Chloroflexi bacterium HGW-Chloroflexi-10]